MIFVSVGTHEQGFDRLISKIDQLKRNHLIMDVVYCQIGYCKFYPNDCEVKEFLSYSDMIKQVTACSIYITHGGPGSIYLGLKYGKIPIVVPRQKIFNEHVDNHQMNFVRQMEKEQRVIAIYDINELEYKIKNYQQLIRKCKHPDLYNTPQNSDHWLRCKKRV